MSTYRTKATEVEARQHLDETPLKVVSDAYGEQLASKGDYLVGNEKHKVHVIAKAEFEWNYELAHDHPTPPPANPPLVVNSKAAVSGGFIDQPAQEPELPGSGSEVWGSGDWTQHGDGTDYPVAPPSGPVEPAEMPPNPPAELTDSNSVL